MMNKITGEAIGDNIGSTLEVDAEDDELAVGLFLRVKVLLDVRKPLMRGVTMEVNKEGEKIWCPSEYEFLPNFCYICGLLGHTDKSCNAGGWRVKKKPFSSELRVIPSRRRFQEEGRGRSKEGNGLGGSKWERSQGSGSRQDWRDTKRSGSDSVKFSNGSEKGEASTSPIKMLEQGGNEEAAQKLFFGGEAVVATVVENKGLPDNNKGMGVMEKRELSQIDLSRTYSVKEQLTNQVEHGIVGEEMDVEGQQTEGDREDNLKPHVLLAKVLSDERMLTPKQQLDEVHAYQYMFVHLTNKKGTYKKKKEGRNPLTVVGAEQAGTVERKRQLPEEIEVDNLSPKKLKLREGINIGDGMTEEDDGEMGFYNVKAGLPG
jgi:hypothetical protein